MPNKQLIAGMILVSSPLLTAGLSSVSAAELSTLFTTPQEREIIDSNRYRIDDTAPAPVQVEQVTEAPLETTVEEITQNYRISGITLSREGPHTVWINSLAYEDGETLEDNSKIKVLVGDEIKVRITAPDGKHYYATAGQTLDVMYLGAKEN